MSKQKVNVPLKIYKRGFRHSDLDRRFISSQTDWIYTKEEKCLVKVVRDLMKFVMLNNDKSNRLNSPVTSIELYNNGGKKSFTDITMSCGNKFNISFKPCDAVEGNTKDIDPLKELSSDSDLTNVIEYFKSIGEDRRYSIIANGVKFGEFIFTLASLISNKSANDSFFLNHLFSDNNENYSSLFLEFIPKGKKSCHVFTVYVEF